jgi:hypothetical protein
MGEAGNAGNAGNENNESNGDLKNVIIGTWVNGVC